MLGDRLELVRAKKSKLNKKQFAKELDITEQSYNNYFKGSRTLPLEKVILIKQLFNVSTDWLLTGAGEMSTDVEPQAETNLIYVPELDISLSAGHGSYPASHALEIDSRAFSIDWIKKKSLRPNDLKIVRVMGDSMEPLLKHKDVVMIDTSKTIPSEAMPFAIRFGDDLLVKTIQRLGDGNLALVSRNKDYNDIIIDKNCPPEEFDIIGAVVWHAHSWI